MFFIWEGKKKGLKTLEASRKHQAEQTKPVRNWPFAFLNHQNVLLEISEPQPESRPRRETSVSHDPLKREASLPCRFRWCTEKQVIFFFFFFGLSILIQLGILEVSRHHHLVDQRYLLGKTMRKGKKINMDELPALCKNVQKTCSIQPPCTRSTWVSLALSCLHGHHAASWFFP